MDELRVLQVRYEQAKARTSPETQAPTHLHSDRVWLGIYATLAQESDAYIAGLLARIRELSALHGFADNLPQSSDAVAEVAPQSLDLISNDYYEFNLRQYQYPDGRIEFTAQVEYAPDETLGRGATAYEAIRDSVRLIEKTGWRP